MKLVKTLCLLNLLFSSVCYAQNNNSTIVAANDTTANHLAAVIGYQTVTDNKLWQEKQLGFGVTAILQQALEDKTLFSLLDEKVLFGVKNQNLEDDIQAQWMLGENQTTPEVLKSLAEKHKLTDIFWVKITDFVSKKSKISFGIVGHYEYKDTLTLEVCRYATLSNNIECAEGEASESRDLNGILYQPADNIAKKFKESGAGKLSQAAILDALTRLLKL